jgi:hypothetical protein
MVHNIGCRPPRVNSSSVLVDVIISEALLSSRATAIELSDCDGKDGEVRSQLTALHFAPLRCCAAVHALTCGKLWPVHGVPRNRGRMIGRNLFGSARNATNS